MFASISREYVVFPAVTVCNINRLRRSRIPDTPYQGIMELDDTLSNRIEIKELLNVFSNFFHTNHSSVPTDNVTSFLHWPVGHNSADNYTEFFNATNDNLTSLPDRHVAYNPSNVYDYTNAGENIYEYYYNYFSDLKNYYNDYHSDLFAVSALCGLKLCRY